MLDFGFEKLLIIGIVGVIVLGPERLPVVAKMVGFAWGRLQKSISQFKMQFQKLQDLQDLAENPRALLGMELEQKKRDIQFQNFYQNASLDNINQNNFENSFKNIQQDFQNIESDFDIFVQKQNQSLKNLQSNALNNDLNNARILADAAEQSAYKTVRLSSRWRMKSLTQPLWYQYQSKKKRRIEGASARMQRYQIYKNSKKMKSSIF